MDQTEVFYEIHRGAGKKGPGDSASTLRAFSLLKELPAEPLILDIGCGSGRQTLDLAALTGGFIIALDLSASFLDELKSKLRPPTLAARVEGVCANMTALPFANSRFDVIWAEGSIYLAGFARGLRDWRRLLKPGGYVVVTELSWTRKSPPTEAKKFWDKAYPAMQSIEENLSILRGCGYSIIDCFSLPESAWFEGYYSVIEERLASLRDSHQTERDALSIIEATQAEIDLYKKYSSSYGYAFYVGRLE